MRQTPMAIAAWTQISYYASGPQTGYPQSIAIDEPGVHLTSTFEYDARGNLTRCVDPRGNDCLFTYNSLDQCVQAMSPPNISARCATDFAYDANDNLVQVSTELRDAGDNLIGTSVGSRQLRFPPSPHRSGAGH